MNTVVILMDSLNRHFLSAYGNGWVHTPNIDRLAARSVVFDRHYIASMPCMPARHDLWTGNLEFLWRPWGPVEPGEVTLPQRLAGKATRQLVTDHYHFFERGGETYHIDFDGWEFIRGHENDPWITRPNNVEVKGVCTPRYKNTMARLRREEDFFSARTFQAAADWLDDNHDQHDQFLLFIDEFDPHEPFHCSEPYNSMYDPQWDDPPLFWPSYGPAMRYSPEELKHLRAQYAGKLTMADRWLGRVLDKLDEYGLWEDTMVILTTDHGHFLGEHEWVGKGIYPQYQPIAHIPLMIACPGVAPRRANALSTVVDICATVLDAMGVAPGEMDGRSLMPVLRGQAESVRDWALYGWFGAYLQITDGDFTYLRAPESPDNGPLYMYRLTWNTAPWWSVPIPDDRLEIGRYHPRERRMIGRMKLTEDEKARLGITAAQVSQPTQLYDVRTDETQTNNLAEDQELRARYEALLARAMREVGCPPEQFERLGLAESAGIAVT